MIFIWTDLGLTAEKKTADERQKSKHIELFSAMDQGKIDAKLIARNSMNSTITIKNKTDEPLIIDMPAAFAGVPVTAQFEDRTAIALGLGMGAGHAMGEAMMSGSQSNSQSVGGGSGGRSGSGGGSGAGGGWFVAPEKTLHHKVKTVCLEHGKDEPAISIRYKLVPIDRYTNNKTTQVLCEMLNDDKADQYAIQAAVWNTENKISFNELAAKRTTLEGTARQVNFFSSRQMNNAGNVLIKAKEEADRRQKNEDLKKENINNNDSYQTENQTNKDQVDRTIENLTEKLLDK